MRIVGHGIDMVSVERIAGMVVEHGQPFLERCFTAGERAYMVGGRRYHEHLAARFAAKEAAMKALGTGLSSGVSWHDFEVLREGSGAPRLAIAGRVGRVAGWVACMQASSAPPGQKRSRATSSTGGAAPGLRRASLHPWL